MKVIAHFTILDESQPIKKSRHSQKVPRATNRHPTRQTPLRASRDARDASTRIERDYKNFPRSFKRVTSDRSTRVKRRDGG